MKILILAPMPFFTDRETQIRVLEEASAFEKLEHRVVIVTYHLGKTVFAESERRVSVERVGGWLFRKSRINGWIGRRRFLADFLLLVRALWVAKEFQPDVIHAHLRSGAVIGTLLQKLLSGSRIPLVVNFHGWPGESQKPPGRLERWILELGDFAVVSTKKCGAAIARYRKKPFEIIFDGVNIVRFLGLPPKMSGRTDLELPIDQPIIAYTGSLYPNRGVEHLLKAIPLVLESHPDAFFIIAGFPIENALIFIKDRNLEKNVRLITPLSYFDLPKLLNLSDIGVDPKVSGEYESSWKVLQYMAAGLPVVCFDQENNRHHLGEGAYFSADISEKGIAEGIIYFLKNQPIAREKGIANQKKVVEYSWGRSADKLELIYCNLLKSCPEK